MLSGAEKPKRGPGRPPKAISEKRSKEKILADANTSILANEESVRSQSIRNKSVRVKSKESSTSSESEPTVDIGSSIVEKKWASKRGDGIYFPPTSSAYEVLGLQTKEPGSRPPILHMGTEARPFMNWAANDCARSMALLRRARPMRTLSASFFDRIEVLRKVILAEIAKAGDTLTAMAVVGVILDREALLLSAEEIYGPTKAKDIVLDEGPGNYPDIATELDQARRAKRRPMRRETGRGAANTQKMSKQSSPYFIQKPFRGRGVKVLQPPWRPRKEGMRALEADRRRWSGRSNECSVEGMEKDGSPEVGRPVVETRGPTEMEGPPSNPGSEGRYETVERSRNRVRQTCGSRRVYKARVQDMLAHFSYSEERRNYAAYPRPEASESGVGCPTLHAAWRTGSGRRCAGLEGSGYLGLAQGISTGHDVRGGETIFRSEMARNVCGIHGVAFRAFDKPIRFYSDNRVASEDHPKIVWIADSNLYRRFPDRGRKQGDIGEGFSRDQEALQPLGGDLVTKDIPSAEGRSGILRVCLEREGKDGEHHRRTEEGVSKKDKEFTEDRADEESVAASDRKVALSEGSHGTHAETREVANASDTEKKTREVYCGRRRSKRRPPVVVRSALPPDFVWFGQGASVSDDNDRCVRELAGRNIGNVGQELREEGERSNHRRERRGQRDEERGRSTEDNFAEEDRGCKQPHKHKGVRSAVQDDRREQGEVARKKSIVVHRQCHGKSSDSSSGDTRIGTRGMEHNKEDLGFTASTEDKSGAQACSWEAQLPGGLSIQARRRKKRVGTGTHEDHECLGTTTSRPLGVHERSSYNNRNTRMEGQKDFTRATNRQDQRDFGPSGEGERDTTSESAISLDTDGSYGDSSVEGISLVAEVGGHEERVDTSGKASSQRAGEMGGQEWPLAKLDSFTNSPRWKLWSEGTVKKYQRTLSTFWSWAKDNTGSDEDITKKIQGYITYLSESKSGKNIETTTRTLLALLGGEIKIEERESLLMHMRICRKSANQCNPPVVKAAEAIKYAEVLDILRRVSTRDVTGVERLALDILVVTFCTMSRSHEITSLEVDSVAEDGRSILVRPKTEAKSWTLYKKCVKDNRNLRPASILRERREKALENNRKYLFSDGAEDLPITTDKVTKTLKKIVNKLGIKKRITAHSARKGAAVELLLRGVPLVAIKSWGIWANVDTLEAYVGRTVREEVSLLDFLPAAAL